MTIYQNFILRGVRILNSLLIFLVLIPFVTGFVASALILSKPLDRSTKVAIFWLSAIAALLFIFYYILTMVPQLAAYSFVASIQVISVLSTNTIVTDILLPYQKISDSSLALV